MNVYLVYSRANRDLAFAIQEECLRAGLTVYVDWSFMDTTLVRDSIARSDAVIVLWTKEFLKNDSCHIEITTAVEQNKRRIAVPIPEGASSRLPDEIAANYQICWVADRADIGRAIAQLLTTSPVQSCAISYSFLDEEFASRLHRDLTGGGIRCWLASHDMRGGERLYDQVVRAISSRDRLIVVLSEHSIRSDWVATEIATASRLELDRNRPILFPVRVTTMDRIRSWRSFDADSGKDLARELRQYYIPDFSDWQRPEKYDLALQRLLADLKGTRAAKEL